MASLSDEVKTFIVHRLAHFDRPSEVVAAVKAEFDVVVSRQQVEFYDPTKKCTVKKWVAIHAATRKAFLEHEAGIASTHRSWRIAELEDGARLAKKAKNYRLMAMLLEQIAKEKGDFYVNARANTPAAETEEQRVQRMRQQFTAMDSATLGTPVATGPALVRGVA